MTRTLTAASALVRDGWREITTGRPCQSSTVHRHPHRPPHPPGQPAPLPVRYPGAALVIYQNLYGLHPDPHTRPPGFPWFRTAGERAT